MSIIVLYWPSVTENFTKVIPKIELELIQVLIKIVC
jgi:hypothetical protein